MNKKRILSIFITICMILTMMPVSAFAADPYADVRTDDVQPANLSDNSGNVEDPLYDKTSYQVTTNPDGDVTVVNIAIDQLKYHQGDTNLGADSANHPWIGFWVPAPTTATHIKAGAGSTKEESLELDADFVEIANPSKEYPIADCWKGTSEQRGIVQYYDAGSFIKVPDAAAYLTVQWYSAANESNKVGTATTYSVNMDGVKFKDYLAKFDVRKDDGSAEGSAFADATITVTETGKDTNLTDGLKTDAQGIAWVEGLDRTKTSYTYTVSAEGYEPVTGTLTAPTGNTNIIDKNSVTAKSADGKEYIKLTKKPVVSVNLSGMSGEATPAEFEVGKDIKTESIQLPGSDFPEGVKITIGNEEVDAANYEYKSDAGTITFQFQAAKELAEGDDITITAVATNSASLKFVVTDDATPAKKMADVPIKFTGTDSEDQAITAETFTTDENGEVIILNLKAGSEYSYTIDATASYQAVPATTGTVGAAANTTEVPVKLTTIDQSAATVEVTDTTIAAGEALPLSISAAVGVDGTQLTDAEGTTHKVTITAKLGSGTETEYEAKAPISIKNGVATAEVEGLTTAGNWTISKVAIIGIKTVTLTSSPVSVTVEAGEPENIAITQAPTAPPKSGEELAVQPKVKVTDHYGNTCDGVEVTAQPKVNDWTLGGDVAVNTVSGIAEFTDLTAAGKSSAAVSGAVIMFSIGAAGSEITAESAPFDIPGPTATVSFTVTDGTNPISDAKITLTLTGGSNTITLVTDDQGEASDDVPIGTYTYEVEKTGYEVTDPEELTVDATTANDTVSKSVTMSPKSVYVQFAVSGLAGTDKAEIAITGESGAKTPESTGDYKGYYRLSVGEEVTYTVTVTSTEGNDYAGKTGQATITASDKASFTYTIPIEKLENKYSAPFLIKDANGTLANANISVVAKGVSGATPITARSGADGKATIEGLTKGVEYSYTVSMPNYGLGTGDIAKVEANADTNTATLTTVTLSAKTGAAKFYLDFDTPTTEGVKITVTDTATSADETPVTSGTNNIYSVPSLTATKLYKYKVEVTGFVTVEGEIPAQNIGNAEAMITVPMKKKNPKYTVTFDIKPEEAADADIVVKLTNADGADQTAKSDNAKVYELSDWANTYWYKISKTGYKPVEGTIAALTDTTGGKYDGSTSKTIPITLTKTDKAYTAKVKSKNATVVKVLESGKEVTPISVAAGTGSDSGYTIYTYTLDQEKTYTYAASAPDHENQTGSITANAATVTVDLPAVVHDYNLAFNVTDKNSNKINKATITIAEAESGEAFTNGSPYITNANGVVNVTALQDNVEYTYTVMATGFASTSGVIPAGYAEDSVDVVMLADTVVATTATKLNEDKVIDADDKDKFSVADDTMDAEAKKEAAEAIITTVASTELPATTADTIAKAGAEDPATEAKVAEAESKKEEIAAKLSGAEPKVMVHTFTEVTPKQYTETSSEDGSAVTKKLVVDITPKAQVIVTKRNESNAAIAHELKEGSLKEGKDYVTHGDAVEVKELEAPVKVDIKVGGIFENGSVVFVKHTHKPANGGADIIEFFRSLVKDSNISIFTDKFSEVELSSTDDSGNVAYVNGKGYPTLQAAVEAAPNNATITVTDTPDDTQAKVTLKEDKNVTFVPGSDSVTVRVIGNNGEFTPNDDGSVSFIGLANIPVNNGGTNKPNEDDKKPGSDTSGDDDDDEPVNKPSGGGSSSGGGSGGGSSSGGGSGSGSGSGSSSGSDDGDDKPTTPAAKFTDVAFGAYYADAVDWAVEKGITNGLTDTTFGPESSCTRAQMVTFLWRANGSPEPQSASNPFTDIDSSSYYYKAVLWAIEKGITNGTSATTFSPVQTVNRGQTVTFLYRNAGSPEATGSNPFTDVASGMYYENAVKWAVAEGITTGKSTTSFAPNDNCTRGQIVTFLFRNMGE